METSNTFTVIYFIVIIYYIYNNNDDTIPIQYIDLIFIWFTYSLIFLMWQFYDLNFMDIYFNYTCINYINDYITEGLYFFNHKDSLLFLLDSWIILSPRTRYVRMQLNRVEFILFYFISGYITRSILEKLQYKLYGYKYGIMGPSGIMFAFSGFQRVNQLYLPMLLLLIYFIILRKDYLFIVSAACGYTIGYLYSFIHI